MSNKLIILSILAYTAFFSSFSHSYEKTDIENKLKTIKKSISKENQKKK